jgi:hypothetical protein
LVLSDMSNPLRLFIIVALIVVVAFSLCAEGPFDACSDVCCGMSDCLRPTGRVVRGLGGLLALAASTAFGLLALTSFSWAESAERFILCPTVIATAPLMRI